MHKELLEKELVFKINGCAFEVYRELGHGFLEKVYERALLRELRAQGLHVQSQVPIQVLYKGEIVGDYCADLIVNDKVIVEIKAQENLTRAHESQILNYLKATSFKVGLLVNFTYPKAKIKRFIF